MWQLRYTKGAAKSLVRMPQKQREQIKHKMALLSENPHRTDLHTASLKGREGYRLRVGNWRVLYDLEADDLIVLVLKVDSRGGVYK